MTFLLDVTNHEQKKKQNKKQNKKQLDIAYFYHNLVLLLRKYIKSMTILKSFEISLIWAVEQNSNLKTVDVMLIWKKSIKLKSARYLEFMD